MFEDRTVLVLGAGTSRPYGFPTSWELRRMILGDSLNFFQKVGSANAGKLASDQEEDFLRCAYGQPHTLEKFRKVFHDAQRVSIDSFIAGRIGVPDPDDFSTVARNAISSVILRCEAHADLDGDWYQWLLEFLVAEGRDFPAGLLSIVTFNYDRSLEFYLLRAFQNAFGIDQTAAVEMLKKIEFVHVYGSVGALPMGTSSGIGFGRTDLCFVASSGIGLVTPRTLEANQVRARQLLGEAARIIFLGFGFWKENVDALCPGPVTNNTIWAGKHVFASRYKLWGSTQSQTNGRFAFRHNQSHQLVPLINWGKEDQDVYSFVTHWNLKATQY